MTTTTPPKAAHQPTRNPTAQPNAQPTTQPTTQPMIGANPTEPALQPPQPPGLALLLLELRALPELAAFAAVAPTLFATAPRGDGQPVLVLPGLAAADGSTAFLRAFFKSIGYPTYGWEMGRNLGPRPGVEGALQKRLATIAADHGRKVSIIGWSLGGIYARQLAKLVPDQVRQVITLGSPFKGDPRATNAWQLYQIASGLSVDDRDTHLGGDLEAAPPVPSTAIYSRSDGICAWRNCLEDRGAMLENIRIHSSHVGLVHNPTAIYAIADRLAQPQDKWRPFDRNGVKAYLYPEAD